MPGSTDHVGGRLVEVERQAVHAVALAGGLRAVGEDVAEVRAAAPAAHLGADHAVGAVLDQLDGVGDLRLVEARPAAARLELRRRVEQLGTARRARYVPSSWLLTYSPLHGRSVPASRSTWYCSGVSRSRHSASVRSISAMDPPRAVRRSDRMRLRYLMRPCAMEDEEPVRCPSCLSSARSRREQLPLTEALVNDHIAETARRRRPVPRCPAEPLTEPGSGLRRGRVGGA